MKDELSGYDVSTVVVEPDKPVWVISNALIQRLDLQPPDNSHGGMVVFGEDEKPYDIDHIMRRFLEVAENLIKEGNEK